MDDLPDDAEIVACARAGDPAAVEMLYAAHASAIRATLARVAGRDHAEDLVQEVFLRAMLGLATFRGDSSLRHWLQRVAVNCALKHVKREKLRATAAARLEPAPPAPGPEEHAVAADDRRQARQALAAVPAPDRRLLFLREVLGLSYEAIRERLTLASAGTVKSRLHYAREAIRRAWNLRRVATGRDDE